MIIMNFEFFRLKENCNKYCNKKKQKKCNNKI